LLDRPRVDVTLRISGLFRDAFDTQIGLFDLAVRTLARRDELLDDNALVAARDLKGAEFRRATMRIFGAPPGDYGSELPERIARRRWRVKDDLGVAYIAASHFAYGADLEGQSADDEFRALVRTADALVHTQDHAEIDILDSLDFGAHEGGFAAAAAMLGSHPTLYHADTSRPDAPRTRTVEEEVRRVVRARAANPAWIAGMKRHGYRGAAEITRSLDGLFTFAATMPHRFDQQFEILFEATMADHNTAAFIRKENPAAFAALQQRFNEALTRDLWRPRRNDVGTLLTLDDDAY
jgi:cobaltochelatase CobN